MLLLLAHDVDVAVAVDAVLDDKQEDDAEVDSDDLTCLHLDIDDTNESLHTFLWNLFSAWQLAAITRLIIVP